MSEPFLWHGQQLPFWSQHPTHYGGGLGVSQPLGEGLMLGWDSGGKSWSGLVKVASLRCTVCDTVGGVVESGSGTGVCVQVF